MLQGEAADAAGLLLQRRDAAAVVEALAEVVAAGDGAQVDPEGEGQLEPLAVATLLLVHPHVGPEPQAPYVDGLGHRGRGRWLKLRVPSA